MSRNFELLARIEQEQGAGVLAIPSDIALSPAVAVECRQVMPAEDRSRAEVVKLVHTLFFSGGKSAPRQVLFCNVDQGESSGRVCVAAGKVLAQEVSAPVCVVDAKMGKPSLHRWFDVEGWGMTGKTRRAGFRELATPISQNLWFLAPEHLASGNGSAGSAKQLRSDLQELRNAFDYILVDVSPAGLSTDAAVLGQATDGVVLVLEANATRRSAAVAPKNL